MSIDELVAEAPERRRRLPRWLPFPFIAVGVLIMLAAPTRMWWTTSQDRAEQARHDAIVSSVQPMDLLWAQLALPVAQRSVPLIESASRLGGPNSDIQVSTQLRVNEPDRIGVVTTVTSDGITTLLVTWVRDMKNGNLNAFQNGCPAGGAAPYTTLTCEQFVEQALATFTAPG